MGLKSKAQLWSQMIDNVVLNHATTVTKLQYIFQCLIIIICLKDFRYFKSFCIITKLQINSVLFFKNRKFQYEKFKCKLQCLRISAAFIALHCDNHLKLDLMNMYMNTNKKRHGNIMQWNGPCFASRECQHCLSLGCNNYQSRFFVKSWFSSLEKFTSNWSHSISSEYIVLLNS